ncbi:hypothetical protein [Nocardioides sp. AX2bis]|uniref:hypothetical protein n=1 Tax=Nocardioides sp. AX2bis TaxID=2653157 RepID=UPI0012EF54D2|nr:hypothetical protein [Nocardioides sp. AX2bis]VXC11459.1 hypothetical protein NOCARDAX2BIS_430023 [Nocardioides sp. AX2bis]
MLPLLIVFVALIALATLGWLLWRHAGTNEVLSRHSPATNGPGSEPVPLFPPSGVLVSEQVLRSLEPGSLSVWEALEQAAVPVAIEYFPVSDSEITRYRTVPMNASAQRSIEQIVKTLGPGQPTLYRAVLPKGAELVKAAGQSGFRGFSRTGGKTAHAVLKPVAAGGALAAGWPIFAVAGTVMAVDMVAQREIRAHQRRVETILGRQEQRHYAERIKDQRTADAQLTRTISLILDGHQPDLELTLKSAYDEFHRSQQFLQRYCLTIEALVESDGKVDYGRLEAEIGIEGRDHDFFWHLHMARGAVAIRRRALVTEAAALALADPNNPYTAMRKFLDSQVDYLDEAEENVKTITQRLSNVDLKGGWSIAKAVRKRDRIRTLAAPPASQDGAELLFLRTVSGEVVQVVPAEDVEPPQIPASQ